MSYFGQALVGKIIDFLKQTSVKLQRLCLPDSLLLGCGAGQDRIRPAGSSGFLDRLGLSQREVFQSIDLVSSLLAGAAARRNGARQLSVQDPGFFCLSPCSVLFKTPENSFAQYGKLNFTCSLLTKEITVKYNFKTSGHHDFISGNMTFVYLGLNRL